MMEKRRRGFPSAPSCLEVKCSSILLRPGFGIGGINVAHFPDGSSYASNTGRTSSCLNY